jgi:hypothetical protein
LDLAARQLAIGADGKDSRLIAESRFHDAAVGLLAAFAVLVHHFPR